MALVIEQTATYGDHACHGPGGTYPCIICGRPVRMDKHKNFVHVHDGGYVVVMEDEVENYDPAGELGWQPIGNDCLRRHPEYKPYLSKNIPH